jgi:hypothetical protein
MSATNTIQFWHGNTFHEIHSVVLKLQHTANLHSVTQFIVNAPIKTRDRSPEDGQSKFLQRMSQYMEITPLLNDLTVF